MDLWCDILLMVTASTQVYHMILVGIPYKVQLLPAAPLEGQSSHWTVLSSLPYYSLIGLNGVPPLLSSPQQQQKQ